MRSFYTDPLGYTADICLMTNRSSARVIVRSPEGSTIYTSVYPAWIDAVRSLRFMLPRAINDMTRRPIIDTLRDDVRSFVACVMLCDDGPAAPLTWEDAAYNMSNWAADGVEYPADMTPELLAEVWNETLAEGVRK